MITMTSKNSIGSLIDMVGRNVCPTCGKEFILFALILENQIQGEQLWFDVFNISEEVLDCPNCSLKEKEDLCSGN